MEELVGVRRVGAHNLRQLRQLRLHRGRVERGLSVDAGEKRVLAIAEEPDPVLHPVEVEQLADLESDLGVLVRVERRDAAARGAEGGLAEADLLEGVELLVDVQEHLRAVGDGEARLDAGGLQVGDLLGERADVERDAGADDVEDRGIEAAGRQQMQREAALVVDDRVARVGAALEADDDVRFAGQQVRHLALALVAPVGAYDRGSHVERVSSSRIARNGPGLCHNVPPRSSAGKEGGAAGSPPPLRGIRVSVRAGLRSRRRRRRRRSTRRRRPRP